ncbi:lysozyme inhibitor LprI family protein [Butyrivibrio sp. AE3009]|uniref:lysozyme inhibitor LprI family protein n=1 Tax=Butyrivibrio sp. AE3009 TaxID=1280666 RepID=UPI00040D3DDC|nr:lysozyme inhibitor LprI family protein [Butyrivibrio sp. AE3009]
MTCGLAIATAAMVLTGCAGSTGGEESSSIFEAQSDVNAPEAAGDNAGDNSGAGDAGDNSRAGDAVADGNEQGGNSDTASAEQAYGVSICDETSELDYSYDYDSEIKFAVQNAIVESSSYEEEFQKIDAICEHITSRRKDSENQVEMNMVASYFFKVWDDELNDLWGRFSYGVDEQTKEKVLADQRNWNSMKESAVLEALGPAEEGGSIYPVLYYDLLENSTKTRCYFIAKEFAAFKGVGFAMPAKGVTGLYIDNQGTGEIYGSLYVSEGWESGYDCKVSIYRIGELEGSVEEAGDGKLSFVSYDDNVKGTITYGWDGATFEVTEVNGDSIVSVGDVYEFPFVF